ncbi:hypothetical protein PHYSODRAFT_302773 [Phytophthora sojae]|uniref:Phosphoribosyltransferase domain-containing protein n=1 Tax=Phytophthora sojae (strain P6497) TaxID=1094619 RepID=G4ZS82_PHYSP|nr:hypothetical protein PHYSODRAFT_302773 [Phytophthora sojae]EGZ12978.1 hypothetical protein PHYSODRAFT_302773 [Phytophthora sojae]|eukprot:XP_009530407.1 hypothetical protein PHYSODRAFT_302773 [Phytophthora sojae]
MRHNRGGACMSSSVHVWPPRKRDRCPSPILCNTYFCRRAKAQAFAPGTSTSTGRACLLATRQFARLLARATEHCVAVSPHRKTPGIFGPPSHKQGSVIMATSERDTQVSHNITERRTASTQVEAPLGCNMQGQHEPMGEFMALHAEANGIIRQMSIAATTSTKEAELEEESKTEENEDNNAPHNKPNKRTQEIDRAENFSGPPGEQLMVREIRSSPALLLMTTLRDRRTSPADFRRAAGRLIMLLLEEALSTISARSIEMTTSTGHQTYGLQRTDEFCGVAVGAEGFPFLVLFHQMEPDAPQGSIHIGLETRQQGQSDWRLEHVDLPSDITRYRILLFSSTVNTGGGECKAIEALCSLGVEESRITLVIILCSTDSLVTICGRFPGVQIITSAIDSKVDSATQVIIPGMGDFMARYNGD